ncbi:bacterial low temperature requirement A protein-domain-containing protein [Podospora didyma]|uniref:Bacterial low temperature requirement A protein-domain-containing protein n=1 Tax=Podospora didyma TaxID=330526 RepID=A0AAE0U1R5_9PEZI|nr:bacterial low temperature requirement A protein-domain-containing protein [Podospora didyma]
MSATPRRRPSEFLLPDGRKVLVALPEDVETLRQKYSTATGDGHQVQVEIVVHGSDEHRGFLHQTKQHHESRHAQLRKTLGEDIVNELDSTKAQLMAVTSQLDRLQSNVCERLGANFDKFGFDARLRTYADDDDGTGSEIESAATLGGGGGGGGDGTSQSVAWSDASSRIGGDTIKLFKRPVVKQYFHRGLLWRAAQNTEVMSFELFFDLLYVGIIAINGDHAAEEADGHELLRFVVTFAMSWKIWSDVQQLVSWFETNDILQRLEILFLIACLLGQTTNMLQTFHHEHDHDTYTQLVAFYLAARLFTAAYCALTAFLVPLVKGMMIAQVVGVLTGAALWIGSTQLDMSHDKLALVFVALAVDMFIASAVPISMFRYARLRSTPAAQKIGKFFEFYPAINIEHKVERTNAFVTLVLGYSVVGVIFQSSGSFGLNSFLGKAVLGLVQAYIFNWLYFEVDGANIHTHAIRRHVASALFWQYAHLAFIMAYILAAAALSKLVVITDCINSPLDTLTDFYQHRSAEEISLGLRLYYCVGLGIALLAMGLISVCHEHKVPPTCRLPKWARLANRFAVSVVFFCLSAATHLNSLNLIAVTTCLSAWALLFEIWGKSCTTQSFFGGWGRGKDGGCEYTASCGRSRLDRATKSDGQVDVVELGRSEKTAVPA